jgi:ribonuclease P protein component
MLPSHYRLQLRNKADFFNTTKRWYGQLMTVFYREFDGLNQAAIIVPKKFFKKATQRNKLKRQLGNAVYSLLKETTGLELVIVLKKEAHDKTINAFQDELKKFFNQ